jgi:Na+:H+ antiporter
MTDMHFAIAVLIVMLLLASAVGMITKWVRVPYTIALVVVGLIVSPTHFLPPVQISPELILLIFLPALLFEAAWNLKLDQLRANAAPIFTLATIGVVLSVGVMGSILHYAAGLAWSSSLLFGAIISATDPVSVLALFKKLGAPKRLTIIIESESLFNDGTAVVVFRILLGIIIGATANNSAGALIGSVAFQFALVVIGGLALGAAIGFATSFLISFFDDHLFEITLTTIAAYGSFILAERIHVSPVIAVLVTGIIIGNYARGKHMSENSEVAIDSFWEYAAFVVNSLVFLLIGLSTPVVLLAQYITIILWSILAMTVSRAVAVYGLIPISNRFSNPVSGRWQHVLFWGGLRGSLSIALVLSLPLDTPQRVELTAMTFGAVTFSLLVQGLTVSPLLGLLRIEKSDV